MPSQGAALQVRPRDGRLACRTGIEGQVMATLKINGVRDRSLGSELGRGLPKGKVVVKDAARVQTARAAGSVVSLEGLRPDDVVEIELQDGLRIWSRVEDVPRDFARQSQRGQVTGDTFEMPSEVTIGPKSRSWGGWAVKALKVVGIDVEEKIADFVAAHVEGQLQPGPGLYRCAEDDPTRLTPVSSLDGKGPVLVFLHGTASSTSGSFSGLWEVQGGSLIKPLFNYYGGRVLGYQHRSLTESPIENALALTRALGDLIAPESEVHIVSHSRGGLVGELLARGMRTGAAPFTPDELALFDDDARAVDRAALEALSSTLEQTRIRLTRFVRVACPARGTTLADGRLDRYFSVLVNLVSLIPALKANPMYDALTNVLAGVLKKRTDPRELPGIEAMMPISPLVRMLNNPSVRTAADLHVLGGDLAGTGVFGRLKTLVTDFYYRDDHDVVVNTPAMLGGIERVVPARYWIDTGDQVTHFHYFKRPDTARRLASALTGTSTEFRTLQARPSAVTSSDYVKRAALSTPVVFVLPGIMGSQLTVEDRPVWMSILELADGGMTRLAGKTGVTATGLLPDGYAALCKYLEATHAVVPFPYDWRVSLESAADKLREALDTMLPRAESANQPIRLLAHSMGGLVVRAMLATQKGQQTWARMCEQAGARFIMLGTPNGGSHAIPAMLMGRDALVKKLALVDLRTDHAGLLETIAGFDGVLNLLPHTGGSIDYFDRKQWERLLAMDAPETRGLFGSSIATSKAAGFRWAVPGEAALDRARKLAAVVRDSPLDPARVVYVAGAADETACDIAVDENGPSGRRVTVIATPRGDGRVLWDTGIPKGIRAFYMDTVHGDLANDRRHFAAIVDLLNTGTTSKLPTAPRATRGGDETFEMRDPLPAMVPDEAELVAAALGGRREKVESKPEDARIAVRVVNDNVTNARFPVLVSHYRHDVIVAAEAYLDKRLDGRLSELLRMELYPGPVNTGVVVLNESTSGDLSLHPGAIVAGLGDVGQVTPGSLTSTLTHALTLYGADCVGRARRRQQREGRVAESTIQASVSAILVGSGEGGLSLADSVRALLRAVLQANQRLRGGVGGTDNAGGSPVAQIDQVEIFELYEDRAIEGLHALRVLTQAPEFDAYVVDELLVRGEEWQRRVRFAQSQGWWQRIRVVSEVDDALKFEAVTQTARAPSRLRPTQRGLVDGFVQQALETTANDPKLGQTLFELLVPNDFKPYAPDRRKLALMLNEGAAAIPWELIRDGFDRSAEPLSVSSGMIRQLLLGDERSQVFRATSNTALVIGNPIVSDERFPSLSGAAAEAAGVATHLSDASYDVHLLLEEAATPMAVLSAIHDRPWRILHFAAHGVFDFEAEEGKAHVSGLVLDNGLFFTAAEADQLRHVPELVFINCCHLGQTRGDAAPQAAFHKLAANLATQFIKIGARAVVAAGWEVNDAAAKTFATSFYRCMLDGELYGDAVLQARRDTYATHGETNTWGAYQCYGDPSFSLHAGQSSSRDDAFVSESELCLWLERMTAGAREYSGADGTLQAQLEARVAQTPPAWWKSASLCAIAGDAFAELGQFEQAVRYYEQMLHAEKATAPMRAVEQLASCRTRWAGALIRQSPPDTERAAGLLDQAEKALESLIAIGETSERYSLLGSVRKRRALMAGIDAAARRKALREMKDAYWKAYDLSRKNGRPDAYPLGNQIAVDVVLSWRSKDGTTADAVAASLTDLEQIATALAATHTDTFNLSAAAERLLLRALLQRNLNDKARDRIVEAYTAAMSRGATSKVRDSMRTQFAFFRQLMETEYPKEGRAEMIRQLTLLQERLLG
jgi:triacylglycerol esterase/lipase EstA (alpha/beta hydrolase family)